MINSRKKKNIQKLIDSFGKHKDETFDFEQIDKYFRNKDNSNSFQIISDKTCNDLDFNELFTFTDRTTSKVGQQFLYNRLRTIPTHSDETTKHEELIQEFTDNEKFRVEIQQELQKLNSSSAYYIRSIFQDQHIKAPKWFLIVRLLSFTSILCVLLLPINPQLLFLLLAVFVVNMGIHYTNKKNIFEYTASIPQLLKLNKAAHNLINFSQLKAITPDISESISVIDKVKRRMSFFKLEAKLEGDMEALAWGVFELFKTLFLLEPLLLFGVLKQLDTKRSEIENVFSFVGQVDTLISIASLRASNKNYCIPNITNTKEAIHVNEIYHPLIPNCITNSITVNGKSILLTGSNMSGKTSFIRTIGLNLITAFTINTCFAKTLSTPLLKVNSAIRISDDLMNDKSYYFEEVLTIKEMIDASENAKPNLFLLDEIFKGTNTIERISAGKSILSALTKNGNIVFVSTHDIELADLLKNEYELYHFSEVVDNNNVDFDYKLKEGKLKKRNAIRILEINDYPKEIIDEALEIASGLDKKQKNE